MLGGLHGVGPQAVEVEALGVGQPGHHRHQGRDAEFRGEACDVIDRRALDRGEQQPEVGLGALWAGPIADQGGAPPSAFEVADFGPPFAVAAVEQQQSVADAAPHDDTEIMGLGRGQLDGGARLQRAIDEQAQSGHGFLAGKLLIAYCTPACPKIRKPL